MFVGGILADAGAWQIDKLCAEAENMIHEFPLINKVRKKKIDLLPRGGAEALQLTWADFENTPEFCRRGGDQIESARSRQQVERSASHA